MALTNVPSNPHNNTSPNVLDNSNYADPFAIAATVAAQQGLPQDLLDQVHTDCAALVKNSWLGFLDMFQMNMSFETDYIQFVETTTPDYVIDDDGAVTRSGDVFTIDWSAVEGWEVGEEAFFFRVDDVVQIYDGTVVETGVITAVNKAANTFTAITRNGSAWTGALLDLTVQVIGGDHDKGSCGPEALLELRKTKSKTQKLQIIKDAIKNSGGNKYQYCFPNGEVMWYDDNTMELDRRLNTKIATTLLLEIESDVASPAYAAGKYGSLGLFANLEVNGLVNTGYLTTLAHVQALTAYWDTLGYENREFIAHVDQTQVRHFETIAGEIATSLNINLNVELRNAPDNFAKYGFSSILVDGYTINFTKWELTTGNSPLGKNRVQEAMPKGIIMPMGTVPTKINGVEKRVPYIFKAYQDHAKLGKGGMVRTYMTGGFAGGNGSNCEYLETSKSTTVAIIAVCPEAITLIK